VISKQEYDSILIGVLIVFQSLSKIRSEFQVHGLGCMFSGDAMSVSDFLVVIEKSLECSIHDLFPARIFCSMAPHKPVFLSQPFFPNENGLLGTGTTGAINLIVAKCTASETLDMPYKS
jgi:hypothetical protein